tara:strand:- start:601 stop:1017 length:417 start_codon:yes stop_codon:yes gene_type:complete
MAISVYTKYTAGVESLAEGTNAQTAVWKIALTNTINIADTTFTPGTSDLPTAGGYTAGGNDATLVSSSAVSGIFKLVLNSPAIWTATGAGFTYRYAILYNSTLNVPIGCWDYGSSQLVTASETVQIVLDAINGVFQIT